MLKQPQVWYNIGIIIVVMIYSLDRLWKTMFTLYNLFLVARHIAYEHMVKKLCFAEYAEFTSKSFGPNGARNTNIRPTGRQQNLDKATSADNNTNAASITERGSAETTTGLDY